MLVVKAMATLRLDLAHRGRLAVRIRRADPLDGIRLTHAPQF